MVVVRNRWPSTLCALGVAWLGACTGQVDGRPQSDVDDEILDEGGAGGVVAGKGGRSGAGGQTGGTAAPFTCDRTTARLVPSPIRRLTRIEYVNTVGDLLPGAKTTGLDLPAESAVDGFDNNTDVQNATPALVEAYGKAAVAATSSLTDGANVAGCDVTAPACGRAFVERFGARAFRRPLASDETARFEEFFATQRTRYGGAAAVRMTVQAFLLSPQFLYRPEIGTPAVDRPGVLALDGYEVASRLSYFFWQSMPDDALFEAARLGRLGDVEGIEQEARRLLDSPKAKSAVLHFLDQWLHLDGITRVTRDAKLFPAWQPQMGDRLYEATRRFADRHFWEGEGVKDLLREPKALVDASLARLYGVNAPAADGLSLVSLDPAERRGLLTQAGLLASLAHETFDSPIKRGVYVLDRLLCAPPPPPPPNVPDIPPVAANDAPRTTRQRISETHSRGECQSCHATIDAVGFLFSHYDALGQYRTKDNGFDVDARTTVRDTGDVDGEYQDLLPFVDVLAESPQVEACATRQVFRFGFGRSETDDDACALSDAFTASGGNLRELMVNLVRSDMFRFRPLP